MKKILISVLAFALLVPSLSFAYVSVKGHYKSNGTYVAPYVRSNPNGLKYDNYSYKPSQGLYNSSYGTKGSAWDTPTYVTDPSYYQGKNIYDSTHSSYVSPTYSYPTYTAPSYTAPSYVAPTYTSSYTSPTYNYSGLLNSLSASQYGNYSASAVSASYKPTEKIKEQAIVPYVVKYWADANTATSCNDSHFLNTTDVIFCNDYRQNYDKYNWVASGFKQTENYALYNNLIYSCLGNTKIVTSTSTKPSCVSK